MPWPALLKMRLPRTELKLPAADAKPNDESLPIRTPSPPWCAMRLSAPVTVQPMLWLAEKLVMKMPWLVLPRGPVPLAATLMYGRC